MCILHIVTYHGCGCKVPGTYFCEPVLQAVDHNHAQAVACVDDSLPPAEIDRDHACFRLQCPKKSKFEPWRCCECGHGPNETTTCKYKFEELPDYMRGFKEFEGLNLCNHRLCTKCPKLRYVLTLSWLETCPLAYHDAQLESGGRASRRRRRRRKESGEAQWKESELALAGLMLPACVYYFILFLLFSKLDCWPELNGLGELWKHGLYSGDITATPSTIMKWCRRPRHRQNRKMHKL
ncbi:hypothetical protein IF1G_02128 [Cordyceps javanica]|uniref:Uncharacterized protein n=1 Tax=Cordyceps javanica TaxID=43265 RepID=A0A545VDW4_9HYPO|nr:hypothetical protein IF1G_02128 [Cordyceps javanica]